MNYDQKQLISRIFLFVTEVLAVLTLALGLVVLFSHE